jgi:hypothetical protein
MTKLNIIIEMINKIISDPKKIKLNYIFFNYIVLKYF